ncbi:DUF3426 domain-containing protein [Eionea flava]
MTADNDIITRCPQCATAFRVTAEVLHVANGAVRCGSCLRVFNAKDYLLTDSQQDKPTIPEEEHSPAEDEGFSAISEPLSDEKPLAHEEPSAHREPSTQKEHSTHKKVSANDAHSNSPLPFQAPESEVASKKPNHLASQTRLAPESKSSLFSHGSSANDEPDESWALELLQEAEQTEAALAEETLDEELIFAEKADDFSYEPIVHEPFAHEPQKTSTDYSDELSLSSLETSINPQLTQETSSDALSADISINDLLDETETLESSDQLLDTEDEYSTLIPNNDALTSNTEPAIEPINEVLNDDGWADDLLVDEHSAPDAILVPSMVTTPNDNDSAQQESTITSDPVLAAIDDQAVNASTENEAPKASDKPSVNLDFERDNIHFHEEPPARRQWPWAVSSLLLLIILGGQVAWSQLDHWSTLPSYRAYYESACKIVGCQLPIQTNIKQIRSTHLVVRSHPDQAGALIVDAIIANDAAFSQPFPGIRLIFLNIEEQTIASRIFKPSEYVKGELFGETNMPAEQSIQLSLSIADPGKQAVNYRLEIVPTPP